MRNVCIFLLLLIALLYPISFASNTPNQAPQEPGDVLSHQPLGKLDLAQFDILLYQTHFSPQSQDLKPARTLVISPLPENNNNNGHLIFYGHQTIGANCKCSFSLNGTLADKLESVPGSRAFLQLGFTLVVPDYYGFVCDSSRSGWRSWLSSMFSSTQDSGNQQQLMHPYLVGFPVAASIINSVRAVRKWRPNQYSNRIGGYGWSQGGHATLWTQQLIASYAPELDLRLAGAISPPTQLMDLIALNLQNPVGRYLAILGIDSWPTYYPELSVGQLVSSSKVNSVQRLGQECVLSAHPERNTKLVGLLLLGKNWMIGDPRRDERWQQHLVENTPQPRASSPQLQLMVFQGKLDELIPWQVTQEWVQKATTPIQFYLYANSTHSGVKNFALPILVYEARRIFLTPQI